MEINLISFWLTSLLLRRLLDIMTYHSKLFLFFLFVHRESKLQVAMMGINFSISQNLPYLIKFVLSD